MNVHIASVDFDLQGYAVIQPIGDIDYSDMRRRFNKVKTLDGGVAVNDGGFSHGDRSVTVTFRQTEALDTTLKHIVETHSRVTAGLPDGCYTAVLTYTPTLSNGRIVLSLIEKVSG